MLTAIVILALLIFTPTDKFEKRLESFENLFIIIMILDLAGMIISAVIISNIHQQ
jgi:hypothetical protein